VLNDQVDHLPQSVRAPYLKLKSEIAAQRFMLAGQRLIDTVEPKF
jgi:hypothetical protein